MPEFVVTLEQILTAKVTVEAADEVDALTVAEYEQDVDWVPLEPVAVGVEVPQ